MSYLFIYLFVYLFIYFYVNVLVNEGENSQFFQQHQAVIKILPRFLFSSCIREQDSGDEA